VNYAFFQRLAQDFQRPAIEFRPFVEKEHAVVRHADFAGHRTPIMSAAAYGHGGGGVVRAISFFPSRAATLVGALHYFRAVAQCGLERAQFRRSLAPVGKLFRLRHVFCFGPHPGGALALHLNTVKFLPRRFHSI
jgi:hypothetical protein